MDVTAITGIISSVVGFALMNHNPKKKTTSSSQTNASNTSDSNSEPTPDIPAQREDYEKEEETNEEKRSNSMYKGKDFDGGVYDSFYDYSAKNGNEKIYFQQSFLDNITSNDERVKACRVRMLSPYVTSEMLGDDSGFIGGKATIKKAYNGGYKDVIMPFMYRNGNETMIVVDGDKYTSKNVLKLAKGNVRNVTVFLQVFNPCKVPVRIEVLTVENIYVGETKCQPIHLRSDAYGMRRIYHKEASSSTSSGRSERSSLVYDEPLNERPTNTNDTMRSDRASLYNAGNETYFAGRELWTENASKSDFDKDNLKWREMAYPVDAVRNRPSMLKTSGNKIGVVGNDVYEGVQNETLIANGTYKVGLSTEVYNYDGGEFFSPDFLTIEPNGYEIVKIMLPLACLNETKVSFSDAIESKGIVPLNRFIFDGRSSGRGDQGNVSNIIEEAVYEQGKDSFETFIRDNKFEGSLLFDFVPAPSLSNKNFKMTVEMFGDKSKCYPKGDPNLVVYSSTSVGNREDLIMYAQEVKEDDTNWRHSYYGAGPDETLQAQTQTGILTNNLRYINSFLYCFSTEINN